MNTSRSIGLGAVALLGVALVTIDGRSSYLVGQFLELPVRAHLVRSREGGALDCTRSEIDVRELLEEANGYWEQAGIRWVLESIVTLEIDPAPELERFLAHDTNDEQEKQRIRQRLRPLLEGAMPDRGWLRGGLDLVLVETFGAYGGGYYAGGGRVFLPHYGVVEIGRRDEIPPVILAHELGHALDLDHVPCGRRGNIMLGRCSERSRDVDRLDPEQIRVARRRAREALAALAARVE